MTLTNWNGCLPTSPRVLPASGTRMPSRRFQPVRRSWTSDAAAGMDLLLAALHVGPTGRAIGVDMTAEMREQAQARREGAGFDARRGEGWRRHAASG